MTSRKTSQQLLESRTNGPSSTTVNVYMASMFLYRPIWTFT